MKSDGRIVASEDTRFSGLEYDYRKGLMYATGAPRGRQARKNGPPLLFATDVRTTLLVCLAKANGPMRPVWLWRHLRKRCPTALAELVRCGLVVQWALNRNTVFVDLDPCHPAAKELRELLLGIAARYKGFPDLEHDVKALDAGEAPVRRHRLRDVRNTFGGCFGTMPLLLVHILEECLTSDIERCLPYGEAKTIRRTLYMFRAFGLLKMRRIVVRKLRGFAFRFSEEHALVPMIRAVLAKLDAMMPQWRIAAERQVRSLRPSRGGKYDGLTKQGRW